MAASNASSVAQLLSPEKYAPIELGPEQARDFHFAVTWVSLFAHLDLIESTGPRPKAETPSPQLALVPVVVAPPSLTPRRTEQILPAIAESQQFVTDDANAAWEMVVPKMIRTGARTFIPAEDTARRPQDE